VMLETYMLLGFLSLGLLIWRATRSDWGTRRVLRSGVRFPGPGYRRRPGGDVFVGPVASAGLLSIAPAQRTRFDWIVGSVALLLSAAIVK
jgi:hypothetical protein